MFDFADRFNKLNLTDEEVAIFSAIVLLSPGNKDFNLLSHWKLDMEAISAKTLTMQSISMHYVFYARVECIACKYKKKTNIYETELEWRIRIFMKLFLNYWKYELGPVWSWAKWPMCFFFVHRKKCTFLLPWIWHSVHCMTDITVFSDRPGLRNVEQLESFQMKLTECLQSMITANHKEDNTLFAKLLMKTTDLRTLNTLHSEKSIGMKFIAMQFHSDYSALFDWKKILYNRKLTQLKLILAIFA